MYLQNILLHLQCNHTRMRKRFKWYCQWFEPILDFHHSPISDSRCSCAHFVLLACVAALGRAGEGKREREGEGSPFPLPFPLRAAAQANASDVVCVVFITMECTQNYSRS